ncbi:hypothetical protein PIROE2DRAFT_65095, partial [Piromyces sp. E2]
NALRCNIDSDCPEYSKCEKVSNSTLSFCKFGSFLCSKKVDDDLKTEKNNDYCVFINTDIWNLDKEEMVGDANRNQKTDIKPILKTCPSHNPNTNMICKTEKCTKNEDCFSGMCQSNICVYNDKIKNEFIYRCSGTDNNNIKCGKHFGVVW